MSTAAMQEPQVTARLPIHGGWDGLFLYARTKEIVGTPVTTPDFDAELHFETTTIMFADVVESVRLIEQDEVRNVKRIRALLKQLAATVVLTHSGILLERRGDGLLIKFLDAKHATACALDMHTQAASSNWGSDPEQRIALRIGIHSAEVIADADAIYGQGINLASRVTSLAGAGETVISAAARDQLVAGVDADLTDLGECFVKHVTGSIHAFRVRSTDPTDHLSEANAATDQEALPRIAVLPFRCVQSDRSAVELVGESLVYALAQTDRCRVTSWLSSRVVSESVGTAQAIGKVLGSQWIVTGSLRQNGEKLLVSVALNHAASDTVETTLRVSGTLTDLLTAESVLIGELSQGIAQRLIEAESKRVSKHALPTLQSHSLLVGAIGLMHRSQRDSFAKSREALEYLLDRHPRMHAVRPWLAQWFVLRNTRGFSDSPQEDARRAIEQTRRALDVLPTDGLSLAMQGFVTFHIVKDIERADRLIDQALLANPNDVFANIFASATKAACGNYETGWTFANRALSAAPFDPLRNYMRSIAASSAILAGRYEACYELSLKSVQENASHPAAWRTLAMSEAITGRFEAARRSAQRLLLLQPELTVDRYRRASHLPPEQLQILSEALATAGVPLR